MPTTRKPERRKEVATQSPTTTYLPTQHENSTTNDDPPETSPLHSTTIERHLERSHVVVNEPSADTAHDTREADQPLPEPEIGTDPVQVATPTPTAGRIRLTRIGRQQ